MVCSQLVVHTTLADLRKAVVAHTDNGPYFVLNDSSHNEAIVDGVVSKVRASLCYIDIEGEIFTALKKKDVVKGDIVSCRLSLKYTNNYPAFTILSFKKRIE
ncbi:MAG: hypothetical protein ACQESC_01500 [Nanobdellota archaeon]